MSNGVIYTGAGSDFLYPDYMTGYKQYLETIGLKNEHTVKTYMNPNTLPIMYTYGIDFNGSTKSMGLRVPLLPGERKELLIQLSNPSGNLFEYAGFIDNLDKYFGTYKNTNTDISRTLPYNKELWDKADTANSPPPFLLISNTVGNETIGSTTTLKYDEHDNNKIQLDVIKPFDYEDKCDFKIAFTNIATSTVPILRFSPSLMMGNLVLRIGDVGTFNSLEVGSILKISDIYKDDIENPFYSDYVDYKTQKYTILSKRTDADSYNYIMVDKPFPNTKNNKGQYVIIDAYTDIANIVHINYFHIRGNPIIQKKETYLKEDVPSIDNFGEKIYAINGKFVDINYLKEFGSYLMNEHKGGEIDSSTRYFQEKIPMSSVTIEFDIIRNFRLKKGDIIRIHEDVYFNIDSGNIDMPNTFFITAKRNRRDNSGKRIESYTAISTNAKKMSSIDYVLLDKTQVNLKAIGTTSLSNFLSIDELSVDKVNRTILDFNTKLPIRDNNGQIILYNPVTLGSFVIDSVNGNYLTCTIKDPTIDIIAGYTGKFVAFDNEYGTELTYYSVTRFSTYSTFVFSFKTTTLTKGKRIDILKINI